MRRYAKYSLNLPVFGKIIIKQEMSHFPSTSVDVKSWISTVLGEDERKSLDIIIRLVDEHEIDGKLLLLLYKYPNELFHLIPNLRARLLFMNALDVLIKAAGKNIPTPLSPCEIPSRSLLWRLASREFKDNSSAHLLNNRSYLASQSSPIESKPSSLVDDLKDAHIPSIAPPESHDRLFNEFESDDGVSEIPSPVPLPVFDHSLQQAIASGRLRERCMRSRLANACARFYVNLKMYPTQLDYHKICEKLVQKYPDLRDGDSKSGCQSWNHLKKLLSMAFCNVRRIMKMKDLMNARHIISSIQRRYRGFSNDNQRLLVPTRNQSHNFRDDHSSSSEESSSSSLKKRVLPNPPPLPTFEVELSKAILEGKLKDRPWSSQFFRRCAKFYTKLKPYPSRRDYKNISNHLSNTFPDLGHPGHIKHMLSQYIRSYRQAKKLWKLDQQQKARMLTLQLSGNKETSVGNSSQSHTHSHGISGTSLHPSSSHIQGRGQVTISADYPYVNYEFASTGDAISKEGSNAVHSNYCGNASGLGTTAFPSHVNEAKLNPVIRNSMPSSLYSNTLSYPVPLPPMDEVMVKGIREGQLQEKNLRNRFIRLCANYYISVKSYPTKEDYNNVCRTIITEFPDLKDPSPLPGCPPFMLFKKALTACIRNKRRDCSASSSTSELTVSPVSKSEGSSQQKNVCSVKMERPLEWAYTSRSHISQTPLHHSSLSEYQNSSLPCFSGVVETLPQSSSLSSLTTYTHTDLLGRENVRSNEEPATSSFLHLRDGFHTGDANVIGAQHGHIPYPVPLPIFSADLTMLLDTGQPILGEARTTFLQTCTDFYLQMKLFPSRTDISAVCAQLVQTFPQLADPGSVLGRMGFNNLKKELSVHFSNYQERVKANQLSSKDEKNHHGVGSVAFQPLGLPTTEDSSLLVTDIPSGHSRSHPSAVSEGVTSQVQVASNVCQVLHEHQTLTQLRGLS